MRWLTLFVAFGLLVAASSSALAALKPRDFAFGSEILLDKDGAIWEVVLPTDVYNHIVRADFGDIRVFNTEQSVVPHALRRPPASQPGTTPEPVSLAVFPLYSTPDGALIGRRMRIVTDERGNIVQSEAEAISAGDLQRLAAYLLDLRDLPRPPSRLELHWRKTEGEGFAATVLIEASNDLTEWTTLVDKATIADLRSGTERLVRDAIDVPDPHWQYLRVTWPEALEDVVLEKVIAKFPPVSVERARDWIEVTGNASPKTPGVYEFDANGHFPIDRIRVSFKEDNVVVRGKLSSRPYQGSPWRPRHRGVYFTVVSGEERVESEAMATAQNADRFWRLELDVAEANLGATPTLALGWVPQVLTFVAQGPPPYTLAYGSSLATPSKKPVAELLTAISEDDRSRAGVKLARLGPEFELGGEARLIPPAPPLPWKTWLLWSVLVLGVMILAWMAVRLFRQLEGSSPKD
jgi:hypothetical protein